MNTQLQQEPRTIVSDTPLGTVDSYYIDPRMLPNIMRMLRNFYVNPLRAVVREYLSNAIDATNLLPPQDRRRIIVTLPTPEDPTLSWRDFGAGMSDATMKTLLLGFASNGVEKQDEALTAEQIGGFGLGAKCAHAIADQFTFTSWHRGIKYVRRSFLNETGDGKSELLYCGPSQEPSGLLVQVPIALTRLEEVKRELISICRYFPRDWLPVVDRAGAGLALEPYDAVEPLLHGTLQHPAGAQPIRWELRALPAIGAAPDLTVVHGVAGGHWLSASAAVPCGPGHTFAVFCPIGMVEVPPSRDANSDTVRNRGIYASIVEQIVAALPGCIERRLASCKTLVEYDAVVMRLKRAAYRYNVSPGTRDFEKAWYSLYADRRVGNLAVRHVGLNNLHPVHDIDAASVFMFKANHNMTLARPGRYGWDSSTADSVMSRVGPAHRRLYVVAEQPEAAGVASALRRTLKPGGRIDDLVMLPGSGARPDSQCIAWSSRRSKNISYAVLVVARDCPVLKMPEMDGTLMVDLDATVANYRASRVYAARQPGQRVASKPPDRWSQLVTGHGDAVMKFSHAAVKLLDTGRTLPCFSRFRGGLYLYKTEYPVSSDEALVLSRYCVPELDIAVALSGLPGTPVLPKYKAATRDAVEFCLERLVAKRSELADVVHGEHGVGVDTLTNSFIIDAYDGELWRRYSELYRHFRKARHAVGDFFRALDAIVPLTLDPQDREVVRIIRERLTTKRPGGNLIKPVKDFKQKYVAVLPDVLRNILTMEIDCQAILRSLDMSDVIVTIERYYGKRK